MKTVYWEYYHPNKTELKKMKDDAVFIFDASSLLSIYSLPQVKMDSLFTTLSTLSTSNRLWMIHQFGEEYYRHKKQKISEQFNYYSQIPRDLDKFFQDSKSKIIPDFKGHYGINKKEIHDKFGVLIEGIKHEIEEKKTAHPDWRENDPICKNLETVFKNKVGVGYSEAEYPGKIEEVEKRIKLKKQPGLSDLKNNLTRDTINGDALAWLQILDYVTVTRKAVILITEETKSDFWEEKRISDKVFPRRALIREVHDKTGQLFFILNLEDFVKFIQDPAYFPVYPEDTDEAVPERSTSTTVAVVGSGDVVLTNI